jgi:ribosomal protein S18 acetylase RimI-like enzyme
LPEEVAGPPRPLEQQLMSKEEPQVSAASGDTAPTARGHWLLAPLTKADLSEVVRLHECCFPGYFLAQLGPWFLKRFYGEFLRHPFSYGVTVRAPDGTLVGFVTGTSDARAHFRGFYRRNALLAVPLVVGKLVTSGEVRRAIGARLGHVRFAFRSLLPGGRRSAAAPTGPANQTPVRLLSIAVSPEYRGSGAAQAVAEYFESILREKGHRRYGLSVRPENSRAIAFYRRTGWQLTYESSAGLWFEKDL